MDEERLNRMIREEAMRLNIAATAAKDEHGALRAMMKDSSPAEFVGEVTANEACLRAGSALEQALGPLKEIMGALGALEGYYAVIVQALTAAYAEGVHRGQERPGFTYWVERDAMTGTLGGAELEPVTPERGTIREAREDMARLINELRDSREPVIMALVRSAGGRTQIVEVIGQNTPMDRWVRRVRIHEEDEG